jgi:hypothetical protein
MNHDSRAHDVRLAVADMPINGNAGMKKLSRNSPLFLYSIHRTLVKKSMFAFLV